MKKMNSPCTRAEFERNFHLLHQRMEAGKMGFVQGISLEGLLRVRTLPNGRVDLLSVDEFARNLVNTMSFFDKETVQDKVNENQAVKNEDVADIERQNA